MKTIAILFGSALILGSCGNMNQENQRKEAMDNLTAYVDSVKIIVEDDAVTNWEEIDRRYAVLEADADEAFADASAEVRVNLDKIEDEYASLQDNFDAQMDEFHKKTQAQIVKLERWLDIRVDETEEAMDATTDSLKQNAEQSMDWLEKNYSKLSDAVQQKYDSLKAEINKDKA